MPAVRTGMNSPGAGQEPGRGTKDKYVPPPSDRVRPSQRPEFQKPQKDVSTERVFHSRYRQLRITMEIGEEKHIGGNRFRKLPNKTIQFEDRMTFGEYRTSDPRVIDFLTQEYAGYDAIGRNNAMCWDAGARAEENSFLQYEGFVQSLASNPELLKRLASDLAQGRFPISDDQILEAMSQRQEQAPASDAGSGAPGNAPTPDVR